MLQFFTIPHILPSAVAAAGNFTVAYPAGTSAATYLGGSGHVISVASGATLRAPKDFVPTFGASTITVTLSAAVALPAGATLLLQFNTVGAGDYLDTPIPRAADDALISEAAVTLMNLGAPATADADGVAASQAVTVGTTPLAVIDGALASGGVATFDVPRNVVAAWTNTAVVTVTGVDVYGAAMVESSASGTSFTGKKAFKRVTAVSFSANVTGATVGTGTVLGLPVFLPLTGLVIREMQDGAVATAGTLVAGSIAAPTATSGDVRGTYTPNAAPNGSRVYQLLLATPPLAGVGGPQYTA